MLKHKGYKKEIVIKLDKWQVLLRKCLNQYKTIERTPRHEMKKKKQTGAL